MEPRVAAIVIPTVETQPQSPAPFNENIDINTAQAQELTNYTFNDSNDIDNALNKKESNDAGGAAEKLSKQNGDNDGVGSGGSDGVGGGFVDGAGGGNGVNIPKLPALPHFNLGAGDGNGVGGGVGDGAGDNGGCSVCNGIEEKNQCHQCQECHEENVNLDPAQVSYIYIL